MDYKLRGILRDYLSIVCMASNEGTSSVVLV